MNDASSILMLALTAVNARMILLLSMAMTFGLFCWAMWMGTVLALCVSAVFALAVFLPVLFRGDQRVREETS